MTERSPRRPWPDVRVSNVDHGRKRGQRVTLVLDRAPDEDFYHHRDVAVGDPTDLSVLRAAGTADAKGVLALSTDDATNGFVVLGVNELDATIPTVAALNDRRRPKIRWHPAGVNQLLQTRKAAGRMVIGAISAGTWRP